nr:NADH dehydrogenase subunit 4L [Orientocreadium sp. HS]
MLSIIFFMAVVVVLCTFGLSLGRLINCLIVVENYNVLLLFSAILSNWDASRVIFIALMVVFTVEVVLGLVVLTRLWDSSCLIGTLGW